MQSLLLALSKKKKKKTDSNVEELVNPKEGLLSQGKCWESETSIKGSRTIIIIIVNIIKSRELQVLSCPTDSAWVGPVESELQKNNIFFF